MDQNKNEVVVEVMPFFRTYKDGRVERLLGTDVVPASQASGNGVLSKDVVIVPETGVSARLYVPENIEAKLPLLVYIHGGAFCIESAFSPVYHNYMNELESKAHIVVVSVEYRLAPEHPLPIAYDDSWAALQWVASISKGNVEEPWLKDYANFDRVLLAGDSAGANIVHNMLIRAGSSKLEGVKLTGAVLIHPFFWGSKSIGSEVQEKRASVDNLWLTICPPSSKGLDGCLINPSNEPNISYLGCERIMVLVAGKDILKDRGLLYCEILQKSGWGGALEVKVAEEEDHVFHLLSPTKGKSVEMMKDVAAFINQI